MTNNTNEQYDFNAFVETICERQIDFGNKMEVYNLIIDIGKEIRKLDEKANEIVYDDRLEADNMVEYVRLMKGSIMTLVENQVYFDSEAG